MFKDYDVEELLILTRYFKGLYNNNPLPSNKYMFVKCKEELKQRYINDQIIEWILK